MKKSTIAHLPKLFYNRFFWELLLAAFMLGMAVFFIRHEHVELLEIKKRFSELNLFYVLVGAIVTLIYLLLQGEMYVQSFKAIGNSVSLRVCMQLFLKRNLVSVFLPAGGFSSLAFFSKNIESKHITKSQVHLASTIYGLCGILSVVVVAIPVLFYALIKGRLQSAEMFGFGFLVLLTVVLIATFISLLKKGWAYRLVERWFPQWALVIGEFSSNEISKKHFTKTLGVSVLIEGAGIAHLYISMLAMGFEPSLPAALIGYIVMVILLIASPLLRGLGAIEVSVAFVLGQYGYALAAAASITLLFRLFEFWIPLFLGIGSFISKRDNLVLRVLPAVLLFTLGITNIVSAITPAIPARLRLVEDVLPEGLIDASNGLVLVSGLVLTLLAVFLLQGSKRAWYVAVTLTALSIVGHLLKGADFEESTLSAVVVAVLLYTKRFYKLKPHPHFTRLSVRVISYGLVAVLLYGVLGFYFIDRRHFGADFVLADSIKAVLKLFFLLDDTGLEPLTEFGRNFIYSLYGAGGAYLVFVIFGLLRPYFTKPFNTDEERSKALELIKAYGRSALDYFKVYPDKLYFLTDDKKSFISFRITRHLAVVLEDPVAPNKEKVKTAIKAFDGYCAENGFVPVYYRVPESSLPIYRSLKKKSFPVGEEAVLDLTAFTLDGGKMKTTRSAINRLSGEGYFFKVYDPPIKEGLLQKLELVSNQWLKEMGQKEIAFTQGIFDVSILKNQTVLTIEDAEEKVYAFLNLVPVYADGMATYDLIRKIADAPNGVLDMLLSKTFLYLKEKGITKVNMGLAPMSGMTGINFKEKTVKYAYENLRGFGHFKGLRKYKEKFYPEWQKTYLVYDHNYHLLQVPRALKKVSNPEY